MDVSKDGKVAFVGSAGGVLRVYDLSNRAMPRLLKAFRLYEIQITICGSLEARCRKGVQLLAGERTSCLRSFCHNVLHASLCELR